MKIYKIQKPLISTTSKLDCLIYEVDETGERVDDENIIMVLKEKFAKKLFGEYDKVYYYCEMNSDNLDIHIDKPALKEMWV